MLLNNTSLIDWLFSPQEVSVHSPCCYLPVHHNWWCHRHLARFSSPLSPWTSLPPHSRHNSPSRTSNSPSSSSTTPASLPAPCCSPPPPPALSNWLSWDLTLDRYSSRPSPWRCCRRHRSARHSISWHINSWHSSSDSSNISSLSNSSCWSAPWSVGGTRSPWTKVMWICPILVDLNLIFSKSQMMRRTTEKSGDPGSVSLTPHNKMMTTMMMNLFSQVLKEILILLLLLHWGDKKA